VFLLAGLGACYAPQAATGVPCSENLECPGDQICDTAASPPVCVKEVTPPFDAPPSDAPITEPDATVLVDGPDASLGTRVISAADLIFPPTETLTRGTGQVAIRNLGSEPLTITSGTITGTAQMTFGGADPACAGQAACTFEPALVVAGQTTTLVDVECRPIAGSTTGLDGTIAFTSDSDMGPDTRATARLTCQPTRALMTTPVTAINFGEVTEDEQATQLLRITNPGTAVLTYRITRGGSDQFSVMAPTCNTSCVLDPGASRDHTIVFAPNDDGEFTAQLRIQSLNADAPAQIIVALEGLGD
jgi:hypothetical protein